MSLLPPLPDGGKAIMPIMQRAQEMTSRDPAIAYWCKMYAARMALELSASVPNIKPWLLALMDSLEAEKEALAENELVKDETAAFAHLETFALKIFAAADREDRAGKASMRTAKTFLAASNYFEVLRVFQNELDESVQEKIKYSKWKATDIVKAIKLGETPRPGPPVAEDGSEIQAPAGDVYGQSAVSPSAYGASESRNSPNYSQTGTCGSGALTNDATTSAPSALGGTFAPHFDGSASGYQHLPPPAAHLMEPQSLVSPATAHLMAPQSPTCFSTTTQAAQPRPAPFPTAPPRSPVVQASPTSQASNYSLTYDPQVIVQAQKHARYVISSLEYDDVPAALQNLRSALALLAPYEKQQK